MSGRRNESLLLDDIVDAAERLIELGSRVPVGSVGLDRDTNEKVLWNLVVLGEAIRRVGSGVRDRFCDVPWVLMADLRNRVAHRYEEVDWEIVSHVLHDELPVLLPRLVEIRDVLRSEFDGGPDG